MAQNPKPIDPDGSVSLVLADDEHEGATLVVVIRDGAGQVLASRETNRGSEQVNESANGMDALDRIGAEAFPGYLVRKDLVRRYAQQFPVPTYVVEFLLGRFCASTDEAEIQEGLQIVETQLRGRTVRASDREKFRSDAREKGSVRLIDLVRARLDARRDRYLVELPSLGERSVGIEAKTVLDNPRMLTDGFYAEVTLQYDALAVQESHGDPFRIECAPAHPDVRPRGAGPIGHRSAEVHDGPMAGFPRSARLGSNLLPWTTAPRGSHCCGWPRSWSRTSTWSNSDPAEPGRVTCTNRSRPTPI